jgi:hypothetical protein
MPKCSKCGSENFLLKEILVPIVEGRISNRDGELMKLLYCKDCGTLIQAFPFDVFDLGMHFIGVEKAVEYLKLELTELLSKNHTD